MTQLYLMFIFMWQNIFRVSDSGINVLLTFIAAFLQVLSSVFNETLKVFVHQPPKSIAAARNYLKGNGNNFVKYVSCPKCHDLFRIECCKIVLPNKQNASGLYGRADLDWNGTCPIPIQVSPPI